MHFLESSQWARATVVFSTLLAPSTLLFFSALVRPVSRRTLLAVFVPLFAFALAIGDAVVTAPAAVLDLRDIRQILVATDNTCSI